MKDFDADWLCQRSLAAFQIVYRYLGLKSVIEEPTQTIRGYIHEILILTTPLLLENTCYMELHNKLHSEFYRHIVKRSMRNNPNRVIVSAFPHFVVNNWERFYKHISTGRLSWQNMSKSSHETFPAYKGIEWGVHESRVNLAQKGRLVELNLLCVLFRYTKEIK